MSEYSSVFKTAFPDRYELLKDYAKENRKTMTLAETLLWEELRGKKLGVVFRRQHPIGDYIADFLTYSGKLIIEIDGGYHDTEQQIGEDMVRSAHLNRLGYQVIRFTNDEVQNTLPNVTNRIREYLNRK